MEAVWTSRRARSEVVAAIWCAVAAATVPTGAQAQGGGGDLRSLAAAIERQQRQLQSQAAELARQQRRIEEQMREIERLRADIGSRQRTAAGAPGAAQSAQAAAPPQAPAPAARRAPRPPGTSPAGPSDAAEAAAARRQEERRVLQTDPSLARVGGVLTPRGALAIEPSVEYAYTSLTRTLVNGFSIIPGITFGEVDIREVQRRTAIAALTMRYGVTDRLELNARIPWVYRDDTVQTQPADLDARPITIGPSGDGLGDIEFGGSYQINQGLDEWPVFIANLRVKSITGRSPFEVPIYTVDDPQGGFLRGLEKKSPTGTGFWSVEPGVTVVWPTDPAVLYGGIRYIWNIERDVDVQSETGGPPVRTSLDPGDGIGLNVGIGFALNEATSLSLGYEHVRVLSSSQEGRRIAASDYDLATFNFGLSYRLSDVAGINLGVGIGVTDAAPDARVILRMPVRFQLF